MTDTKPSRPATRLSIPAGIVLLAVLGPSFGDEPPVPVPKAAAVAPAISAAVRGLYRQRCQSCHQADGTGKGSEPDFSDAHWQSSRSDAQLLVGILDGKGTGMPAFRGKVTDDQARELVAMTRAFTKGGTGAATDFAARFRELQDELAALQKQFHELAEATKAVRARTFLPGATASRRVPPASPPPPHPPRAAR